MKMGKLNVLLMLLVILYKVDVNKCNPVYSDEDYSDEDYGDDYDYQELSQQSDDTNDEDESAEGFEESFVNEPGSKCRPDCYEEVYEYCVKRKYQEKTVLVSRCLNSKKKDEWRSYEQQQFCTTKLIC